MSFSSHPVPPILFRPDALADLGREASALATPGPVLLLLDPFLAAGPVGARAAELLSQAGFAPRLFAGIAGEPRLADLEAAMEAAQGCVLVVGIGGGSVLDVAKIAGCCAPDRADPMRFAGCAEPLPAARLPRLLVPTTAGTGAESSATCVFADAAGAKRWIWGPQARADSILLDPVLTLSLPPRLTAICGLDAFVHAFEAATNRNTHGFAQLYAHEALRLIVPALPAAVADPADLAAREDLLLGACYAGVAIDHCGTAIAHTISHALGSLVPVPHGLATALGFAVALPHVIAARTPQMEAAAWACGLAGAERLPAFFADLMARCGIAPELPEAVRRLPDGALLSAMLAPQNAPMRDATLPTPGEADMAGFAAALTAMAPAAERALS